MRSAVSRCGGEGCARYAGSPLVRQRRSDKCPPRTSSVFLDAHPWQLPFSRKIGDVLVTQGLLRQRALSLSRRSRDRRDTGPQRPGKTQGGSVTSRSTITGTGDVLMTQGQLDDALTTYRDGLAIHKALALREPCSGGRYIETALSRGRSVSRRQKLDG